MTQPAFAENQEIRDRIEALLRQGKNVYQPLYNYPYPQSIAPLRPCADRCAAVEAVIDGQIIGRRLWDVGCSLGFNTLYFVERGMIGHGIDLDARNIALCREIRRWTEGEVRFSQTELRLEAITDIAPGEYDYAFFFSILHHLIEAQGLPHVQDMMRAATARIPVLFVELALQSERPPPGYDWARHLPADELAIFATCDGVEIDLIGRFPTHVGPVTRPLYRVANRRHN